mgnify:CR=1 FL=1
MFFGKSEKRRNPYVIMTVATLATIGAVHVARCVKGATRCMRNKMSVVFKGSRGDIDSMI